MKTKMKMQGCNENHRNLFFEVALSENAKCPLCSEKTENAILLHRIETVAAAIENCSATIKRANKSRYHNKPTCNDDGYP